VGGCEKSAQGNTGLCRKHFNTMSMAKGGATAAAGTGKPYLATT